MSKLKCADKSTGLHKQPLPDFVKENGFFAVYPGNKMTVFLTKKPCPILKGEFAHGNYEFVVTCSPVLGMTLGGTQIDVEPEMLVAVNSGQMHGTNFLISDVSFMNIQFDKCFLEDLAENIYGVKTLKFDNTPVPCGEEIVKLTEMYISEYEQKREGYLYILSNLSVQIAICIFRRSGIAGSLQSEGAKNDTYIEKAAQHLKDHFLEDFSLDELSNIASMSKFNFSRKFKDMTGKTPYDYYLDIRVMNALEYLSNPKFKVIDVALMCGFKNHSHFSQVFRKKTGLSPKEYRRDMLDF
jgi:AraC-like DNA-binding protein